MPNRQTKEASSQTKQADQERVWISHSTSAIIVLNCAVQQVSKSRGQILRAWASTGSPSYRKNAKVPQAATEGQKVGPFHILQNLFLTKLHESLLEFAKAMSCCFEPFNRTKSCREAKAECVVCHTFQVSAGKCAMQVTPAWAHPASV